MDQTENHIKHNIEETRAAMNEKLGIIEQRVHRTMEGTKSTIDSFAEGVDRIKEAIEGTTSAIDNSIGAFKYAVDETVERVSSTAALIDQVKQNPWIMLGSAVLLGYVIGSLNRQEALDKGQAPNEATPSFASHPAAASPVSS
jgi:ElaB/YqjD/DUF883 family membrane-anchored ribosome-binding protein